MELSPEVINDVEFSMARRGYDPDQVDEFLEKVAVAVGELSERLAEARERALSAERRANDLERKSAERSERVVDAPDAAVVSAQAEAELETLKRTLVLAQRTADAAMREAEQEAGRIRNEAEADAARLVSSAEDEARAAHETTRLRLIEEIGVLQSDREGLTDSVRALERHIDEQRLRLRGSIAELQRILDDPARLQPTPPPIPDSVAAPVETSAAAVTEPPEIRVPFVAEVAEADDDDLEEPGEGDGELDDADDDAWARFSAPADDDLDAGPPTAPIRLDDLADRSADDDDAYLAELRKAMLDDTGAPDLDESETVLFDDVEERPARSRFGRRR